MCIAENLVPPPTHVEVEFVDLTHHHQYSSCSVVLPSELIGTRQSPGRGHNSSLTQQQNMNTFLLLLFAFIVMSSSSHHPADAFSIVYRPTMHSSSSQSSMTTRQSLSIEASTSSSTQVLEQSSITIENDTIIKERQRQQKHHQQQHIEEQYNNEEHDRYHLVLLNDAINTRSYVCRILVEVTALSEAESYARMVHAHEHGEAIIGEYCMEYAEHYKEALVNNGLLCEIIPVTE